ncbi:MAG: SIR2 family NAD-dependent protein deacylase [Solirubrobacterales bacterium]
MSDAAVRLAQVLREADSAVALTGAGISVPSGIPDFRTPGEGLWEKVDPMEVATIQAFRSDPKRFWEFYRPRFATLGSKEPNPAHDVLVELEERGLIDGVITQNIDRLHSKAGTKRLIEVHGSIASSSCVGCGSSWPLEDVDALFGDDGVATCTECLGPVKPDVVLFGEMLPEQAISEATDLAARADLMLCIGSSLEVHPVAGLPDITRARGGGLAIVSQGPTPYDGDADIRMNGDVVDDLTAVVAALG